MLIPAAPLTWLCVLLLPAAFAASWWPAWQTWWWQACGALGLLVLADAWRVLRMPMPAVQRRLPHSLALGVEREVVLRFTPVALHAQTLQVFDHAPGGCWIGELPQRFVLPADQGAQRRYRLRPERRGEQCFGDVELRLASPWRLWWRQHRVAAAQPVRVYPNFSALARYALFATDNRLSQLGVLRRRRRGEGLDFHQLREYREGDVQRQIDWKASARMRRLISREYQDERDQQIVLLLDGGRRMSARDGALSHLDHVLDAGLLLAYVALRQGDAVGVLTLAGSERWAAPRKSTATISGLMHLLHDLEPSTHSPDFHAAAVSLMQRMRKRALVVLVTNLRDEDDENLRAALRLLGQRHLVLVASVREAVLAERLRAPVQALDDALTHAATAQYLERRALAFARLEREHVACVDVEPPQLALALVNRYLDLKLSGRL